MVRDVTGCMLFAVLAACGSSADPVSPQPGPSNSAETLTITHDTGDLGEYSATVTDGGDLSVSAGAALAGTRYGLSAVMNDTSPIYGRKVIALATTGVVSARAYVDPNGITMPAGSSFSFAWLINSTAQIVAHMQLVRNTGGTGYQLRATIVPDSGVVDHAVAQDITNAPHYLELRITRATSSTASDGRLDWWLDGVQQTPIIGRDNYDRFANVTDLVAGVPSHPGIGTSGTFHIDEIVLNNSGRYIGGR